ncbi:MAG TPA: PhnD/SsuA/transferrin family substrate-binding protein, partial [Geobacteraceae bacterium]|nr:PhnD/SsuA/transferrin family substrate-binding protein [Geobacteraceae bacterium]
SETEETGWKPCRLIAAIVGVFLFLAPPVTGAANPESSMPKVLRVGFSSNIFTDVDTRDAQVAMELWARELARGAGINHAKVTILNSRKDLISAVRSESIDIVTIPAMEYLDIRNSLPLIPAFVAINHVGRARELILLVSRNSGNKKIRDLRGKTIDLLPEANYKPLHIWLELVLLNGGNGTPLSFFDKINIVSSASQAIMRVFFGKTDAAIVNRGAFDIALTLNPQLKKQLLVIAESRSLIGDISCIPASINPKLRHAMENAAAHLHENTTGKQMIALFHIDRVIPFDSSYISGLEELLSERDKLKGKKEKKGK